LRQYPGGIWRFAQLREASPDVCVVHHRLVPGAVENVGYLVGLTELSCTGAVQSDTLQQGERVLARNAELLAQPSTDGPVIGHES
jgi:hypothetical protein